MTRLRAMGAVLVWAGLLLLPASQALADAIASARYLDPVMRYGHFALGRPHEYAAVAATMASGRVLELRLPEDEVFEDLAPRLVRLAPGEPLEMLVIVSRRHDGARLVLIRQRGEGLEISAQTLAVGTPMRWLNPVGVADLDGDGRAEVAMVSTPHIGGILRVFRREGPQLVELATLPDLSNHVYGSAEADLSTPVALGGRMRLLVPNFARDHLRIIALEAGRLVEVGRCQLPGKVTGSVQVLSPSEVLVGLSSGRHSLRWDECRMTAQLPAGTALSR